MGRRDAADICQHFLILSAGETTHTRRCAAADEVVANS